MTALSRQFHSLGCGCGTYRKAFTGLVVAQPFDSAGRRYRDATPQFSLEGSGVEVADTQGTYTAELHLTPARQPEVAPGLPSNPHSNHGTPNEPR